MAHWAEKDLQEAVRRGLLQGDPAGGLRPDDPLTRAEAAVLANRLYDMAKEFPDQIAAGVDPAVVMVVDEETGQLGSGGSLGAGLIWTNSHVITRPDGTHPFMVGIHWDAGPTGYAMGPVIYNNPHKDLAIIRADIGESRLLLPRLTLAAPGQRLSKGEPLSVFGSPVGMIGTLTHGTVSYINRAVSYTVNGVKTGFREVIQTDAPINPGNSGGVAVNRSGHVVGIPSAKLVDLALEGLGFCISVEELRAVLEEINQLHIPQFERPDYESSPEGYAVSIQTHYMPTPDVTHIIIHHTGDLASDGKPIHRDTSAEAINRYHRTRKSPPWDGIGYHFVVRWDGRIQIGRSVMTKGAHAGSSMNKRSWGVAFSGNFNVGRPTGEQIRSFRWLRRYLEEVKPGLVMAGHRDVRATSCPGKNLRLADLEEGE